MVGTDKPIKSEYITPYGYYTNPVNKRAISFANNRYCFALHNNKNLPIPLVGDNDILVTDGKSYLHIGYDNDKIKQFSKKEIEISTRTMIYNNEYLTNNTSKDYKNIVGGNSTLSTTGDYNNTIGGVCVIKANKIIFDCTDIEFKGLNLTHNGVNIGSTHVHVATSLGSPTSTPQ